MILDLDQPATLAKLGETVGITAQGAHKAEQAGICERSMPAGEWIAAYCSRLREQAAGRQGTPLVRERARLAKEQADAKAMENAVRRKELAPVTALTVVLARACGQIGAQLDAIPGMLRMQRPGLTHDDLVAVETLITEARNRAAEARIDLDDLDDLTGAEAPQPEGNEE